MTWLFTWLAVFSSMPLVVIIVRLKSQRDYDRNRKTYLLTFPTDLDEERVMAWLRAISGTLRSGVSRVSGVPTIVFETWASDTGIVHRLKVPWQDGDYIASQLCSLVPGINVAEDDTRPRLKWTRAIELGMTHQSRQLRIHNHADLSASLLASVQALGPNEVVMMQWVLTPSPPERMPAKAAHSRSNELSVKAVMSGREAALHDEIEDRRAKLADQNLQGVGRIAAFANTEPRAIHLVHRVEQSLAGARSNANGFVRRPTRPATLIERINSASAPMFFPAQFSINELTAVVAWPIGSPHVAGLPQGPTRHLHATEDVPRVGRILGHSNYPGHERPIALGYQHAVQHMYVGGATGCLHPDTPIHDPVNETTKTVLERYEDGVPFHVFAMRGHEIVVARADAPTQFRRVGMYRLRSDEHQIVVTGQHRVWNGKAYVEVENLYEQQANEPVLLPSISVSSLSRLQRDVQHSRQTGVGSPDGCHSSHRSHGQRLLRDSGSVLMSVPSRDGVDGLCCVGHGKGGLASEQECIHAYLQSCQTARSSSTLPYCHGHDSVRHASQDSSASGDSHAPSDCSPGVHCGLPRTGAPLRQSWSQSSSRSLPAARRYCAGHNTSSPLLATTQCGAKCWYDHDRPSQGVQSPRVSPHSISSCSRFLFSDYFNYSSYAVEREGDETYYDFHVPIYENYLAGGLINHNTGKSTLMANSFAQDVSHGYGGIVIDASNSDSNESLFSRALSYVPPDRLDDVIVIDVNRSRHNPVGFNVLDQGNPRVVVDQITDLFGHLYQDTKGVWTRELLFHGLYTLAEHPGMTFIDLTNLLTPRTSEEITWADEVKRSVKDPELLQFWTRWENFSHTERDRYSQPLLNRAWQLISRPETRNIIGQSASSFKMVDVLRDNKILLVSLSGLPQETSMLLGTLLVNALWTAAQTLTPEKPNFLYLDEFQLMTRLPMGLDDMLARARKHKLGVTLGTQYLEDLPAELKNAVINNARSRVIFQSSAKEARTWKNEFGSQYVDENDFIRIRKYEAIAQLATDSGYGAPVTLRSLPPIRTTGVVREAVAMSANKYGRDLADVEGQMVARRKGTTTRKSKRPPVGVREWGK